MAVVGKTAGEVSARAETFNDLAVEQMFHPDLVALNVELPDGYDRILAEVYFALSEAYKFRRLKPGSRTEWTKAAAFTAISVALVKPLRQTRKGRKRGEQDPIWLVLNAMFAMYAAYGFRANPFEFKSFDEKHRVYRALLGLRLPSLTPIIREGRKLKGKFKSKWDIRKKLTDSELASLSLRAASRNFAICDFFSGIGSLMPKVAYVAYIDESGDDGVAKVRPRDPDGATEWFSLSAVVVRQEAQRERVWLRDILADLGYEKKTEFHFRTLDDWRKIKVCHHLSTRPLRCFVVLSNKLNMRAHQNPRAAKVSHGRTWFYWWCARLLLERVTDFCERRSLRDYGEPRVCRLEFSRRLGLRYAHFQSYLYWLRMQSKANALYLDQGDIKWSVLDIMNEVGAYDHSLRAGLMFSDAVASSFYQAVTGEPPDTSFAKQLIPRLARSKAGAMTGYGFKLMPTGYLKAAPVSQREFFASFK